jgi:hypothetical protein
MKRTGYAPTIQRKRGNLARMMPKKPNLPAAPPKKLAKAWLSSLLSSPSAKALNL